MGQSNAEGRIVQLETKVKWLMGRLASLTNRVDGLDATTRQASGIQYGWGGGGGGGGGTYFCVTPSTGSWSGAAPGLGDPADFTADVYRVDGGAYVLVAAGATVYNGYPSSPGTSKVVGLGANDDGTYSVLGESCS